MLESPLFTEGKIIFTNASGIHATNIAEYVFMMLLAFGHRLPTLLDYQREHRWPTKEDYAALIPLELRDSTLGIVGYGSLGREIARVAQAFGMEVLAVKRNVRQPEDTEAHYVISGTGDPEGAHFHRLYPPEALISMVRVCDFVVLTVPLTETTRGMVSAEVLAAMKPSAYLVNVGRGSVVDEEALVQALQEGRLAGAALDVFATEPLPAESPLWALPNVIISPHVAGNTANYNEKAARLFVENLKRYVAQQDLLNRVDREQGY
jgi:phosphoglycerate dehydrogenase-like enzyme